jgi:hypothetical protein
MYSMIDGVYSYDASRIRDAHAWCQQETRQALAGGRCVVVSEHEHESRWAWRRF